MSDPDAQLVAAAEIRARIDTSKPHSARFWNYFVGDKDNYEVAQRLAPDARIVYVDNNPLVLAHARALLTSTPEGETAYLDANLYDPDALLKAAEDTLDFSRPVALMILYTLGHVAEYDQARALVSRLLDALAPGSHLVISDGTATSESVIAASDAHNSSGAVPYYVRSVEEIGGFFDGLELAEPGIVQVTEWRPEPGRSSGTSVDAYGGVGRKRSCSGHTVAAREAG